jgi:signal peptidase II
VVDFVSLFAPDGAKFAIFNVADSSLTVGVVLLVALELFGLRRDGTRVLSNRGDASGAEPGQPGGA